MKLHIPTVICNNIPINFDIKQIRLIIKKGHHPDLVEIKQDISLTSCVRLFSTPWQKVFCVVAKKNIPKFEPICSYPGQLTDMQSAISPYTYSLTKHEMRQHAPAYSGPDLVLDASQYGGIGRFINDNKFRSNHVRANVDPLIVFMGDGIAHIIYFATENIKEGQEVNINKHNTIIHNQFYIHIVVIICIVGL
jgi:hypothetical protein